MKILAIDTSSAALGVALCSEKAMLAEFTQNKALTHSEKLMPLIDIMLKNIDEDIQSVDVVACTTGPGSFTGIRIGVSTANAFAMANKIPVIGISSLEALAHNFKYADHVIVSTMYAQRDDYYRGIYSFEDAKMSIIKSEEAISKDEILLEIREIMKAQKKVILCGEMPDRYRTGLMESEELKTLIEEPGFLIADKNLNFLRSSNLCEIAFDIMADGKIKDMPRYIEPVYIRKPQAEVQYEEKMAKIKDMQNMKDRG